LKILIVKIGAIGDVVMSLLMLEAIDRQWPGSKITWVCGESVAPLLKTIEWIDELVVVNDRKLLKGGKLGAVSQLLPLWLRFLGKGFDLIVTGHSDSRYGLLSLTAWGTIRRRFGDSKEGRFPVPGRYHADEYVRLMTGINGPDAPSGTVPVLKFPLNPDFSKKLVSSKKIVTLTPGGAKNIMRDDALRRWPLVNYVQLAEKLLKSGYQVLITGSESDSWIRDAFKHLPVVDLVGQTSITDLIALFAASDLVVTHDSGPLHLAIASGKPILGLFGPTIPWEKVPKNERVSVLWGGEKLACRPCYDGKNYADCKSNVCLQSVSVDRVYEEVERVLINH
jgi:heptosyltransferase-2